MFANVPDCSQIAGGKSDHYHINEQKRNATRKDFEQVIANKMKLSGDGSLKNAIGKNVNPFFHVEETFAPIISLFKSDNTAKYKLV